MLRHLRNLNSGTAFLESSVRPCLALLGLLLLAGCGTMTTTRPVVNPSVGRPVALIGQYIETENFKELQIHDLGAGVYQYKGAPGDFIPLEERPKVLAQIDAMISEERKKGNSDELQSMMRMRNELATQGRVTADDLLFVTADLGRGWFALQITAKRSWSFTIMGYSPAANDVLVGRLDANGFTVYPSTACQDEALLRKYKIDRAPDSAKLGVPDGAALRGLLVECIDTRLVQRLAETDHRSFVRPK